MLFLISWLIAVYFLAPSAVSCLPFFSALRSSHRSSMLVVTHGLLTGLRLPKISLADSVNALLKTFTSVSTSVSSALSKVNGAILPPIIAWKASAICGSLSFSISNLILVAPCIFIFLKRSRKDNITKSWSLQMSTPGSSSSSFLAKWPRKIG